MLEYNDSPYTYFMYDDGSVYRIDKTGQVKFILKDRSVRSITTQEKYAFILNEEGITYIDDNDDPIMLYQNDQIYKICCRGKFLLILHRHGTVTRFKFGKNEKSVNCLICKNDPNIRFRDISIYNDLMILIDTNDIIYYYYFAYMP